MIVYFMCSVYLGVLSIKQILLLVFQQQHTLTPEMPILTLKTLKHWKEKSKKVDEENDKIVDDDLVCIPKQPEPLFKYILKKDKELT